MRQKQHTGQAAEQAAFTARLEQALPILRKVAAAYGLTTADRHDLMQEIALQLWKAWPRYDPARAFSTWTYRIALNVGISHLRRSSGARRPAVALGELPDDPVAGTGIDPVLEEQIGLLRRLIDGSNGADRALLVLHLDERSHREIAEVLGMSETNVATRLSRIRQRLRDGLAVHNHDRAAPRTKETTQ